MTLLTKILIGLVALALGRFPRVARAGRPELVAPDPV